MSLALVSPYRFMVINRRILARSAEGEANLTKLIVFGAGLTMYRYFLECHV